jgi:hypothetical protein
LNNLNNTNKTKYNDNKQIDKKKNYEARLSNNSILKGETKKNKKQRKKIQSTWVNPLTL